MAEVPAVELHPAPVGARTFTTGRRVRFGEVDRHGRLRLDSLAAYLQDVAGDDTTDAGLRSAGGWVLRRNVVEVRCPPRLGQQLAISTWASGAGSRWAERRLSITSAGAAAGASVEGVSLWVSVDPATLRPVPLDPGFIAAYHGATGGRVVTSRLQHPAAPQPGMALARSPWALRATDIDPFDHVNNAATWAVVEEVQAEDPWPAPFRAEIEYRTPIPPGAAVTVEVHRGTTGTAVWLRDTAVGTLFATAVVRPLAG